MDHRNGAQGVPGGGPVGPSGPTASGPGTPGQMVHAQPEPNLAVLGENKLFKRLLVLLHLFHKCQGRESQTNGEMRQCNFPMCKVINVLTHVIPCQAGMSCPVPHCPSSRQILSHLTICTRQDCLVCAPTRQMMSHWKNCTRKDCPGCAPTRKIISHWKNCIRLDCRLCAPSMQMISHWKICTRQDCPVCGQTRDIISLWKICAIQESCPACEPAEQMMPLLKNCTKQDCVVCASSKLLASGAVAGQIPPTVSKPGPGPGDVPAPISGPSGPSNHPSPPSVPGHVPTGPPVQTAGPRPRGVKRMFEGDTLQPPLSAPPEPTDSMIRNLRPQVPSGDTPGMPVDAQHGVPGSVANSTTGVPGSVANATAGVPGSVANATTGVPGAPGALPGQMVGTSVANKGPDGTMMGPTVPQSINSANMMVRAPNTGSGPVNTFHQHIIGKSPNVGINQNKPVASIMSLLDSWLRLLIQPPPLSCRIGAVAAKPVKGTKEWHQNISNERRIGRFHKMMKAIYPNPDSQALLGGRIHETFAYIRNVEWDIWEKSNSEPEYCHLLTEKVYMIQKVGEKKLLHGKQTPRDGAAVPPGPPGGPQCPGPGVPQGGQVAAPEQVLTPTTCGASPIGGVVIRRPGPRLAHPPGSLIPATHPMASNQVSHPASVCHPSNQIVMGGPTIGGPITATPTTSSSTLANSSGQFTFSASDMIPGSRPSIPPPPYSTPSTSGVKNQMTHRTSPAIPVSSVAPTLGTFMSPSQQSTPCFMANTSSGDNCFPPSQLGSIATTVKNENTVMSASGHTGVNAIGNQPTPLEMTEDQSDIKPLKIEIKRESPGIKSEAEPCDVKEIKTEPKPEPMEFNTSEQTPIKQEPYIKEEPKTPPP